MKILYLLPPILILAVQCGCNHATVFEGDWSGRGVWPNSPEPFLSLNHDGTFTGAQGSGKWVVSGGSVVLTDGKSNSFVDRYHLVHGELENEEEPGRSYTKFFHYRLTRMK